MRLNGFSKFFAPVLLTGLSLLALAVAERRLDDFTQEFGVRKDNSGYRSMKLLGKFKLSKSQSYAPAKAKGHPKPQYHSPPQYAPPNPQYAPAPPQYGPVAPPKSQYVPPQYGPPPKPQYGPPTPQYGPPTPQYGPPTPQHGPPTPQHGPPTPQHSPPKSQYGPPKHQYGPPVVQSHHRPPVGSYGTPPHAYGPPQQAYRPSSSYAKPQPTYAAAPAPPVNAIYSPPQQVYSQPSPSYAPHPAPASPPAPSAPYGQLPVASVPSFSPSPLVTYSATDQPLPQTDYNQPALTLHYNPHQATDDNDDSSESSSSDDSSAPSYSAPEPDKYEPAEPKPSSDDVQVHSVSEQEEAAPAVDVNPPVAVFVATEASVHQYKDSPKQTAFVPSYPHYSEATDNNPPSAEDPQKETGSISSIPNYSVQETDNNQQEAVDAPKETESKIPVSIHKDDANFNIPTISPPISTDEALAYSPNFGDGNAFSDSTDSDFPSIFNLPSNFYKQTENGADGDKDNDFGFFQLGIFPKTSSFFEQNYNG